jgi:hypothetical protein
LNKRIAKLGAEVEALREAGGGTAARQAVPDRDEPVDLVEHGCGGVQVGLAGGLLVIDSIADNASRHGSSWAPRSPRLLAGTYARSRCLCASTGSNGRKGSAEP